MNTTPQTELEKAEIQKLTFLVNLGQFENLTGEEQVKYIDSLEYWERSDFLSKNFSLLKENSPPFTKKFLMDINIVEFFLERNLPFNEASKVKYGINLSRLDFSKSNISVRHLMQAKKFSYSELPEGLDFSRCYFDYKDISGVDFSSSNITFKQWVKASRVVNATLPINRISGGVEFVCLEGYDVPDDYDKSFDLFDWLRESDVIELSDIDFTGCSFKRGRFNSLDFSKTNIKLNQWLPVEDIRDAILPIPKTGGETEFIHFTDDTDPEDTKIWKNLFEYYRCHNDGKLPNIDFTDCSFKDINIHELDLSDTNISGEQFCQANYVYNCILPKGIDFLGCSFEGKNIVGVDFGESSITLEQIRQATDISECKFPEGIDV